MHQFRISFAALTWCVLVIQYWLMVMAGGHAPHHPDLGSRIVEFFSFFTVQSTLLVGGAAAAPSLVPGAALERFFSRASVRSAIAVYTVIVCSVYYLLLRHLWHPQGLPFYTDFALHYVIPIVYVFDWLVLVPKGTLRIKHALLWLIYPALFGVWTLVHGAVSGFYPYPFINVTELGYPRAFLNIGGFVVLFLLLGLLLVGLDWMMARLRLATYSQT